VGRILLVDDSPHAQRMGERILSEEGFEVVTVSNADSALIRLEDVDPDVVIADTVMPGRTGFEICQYLKMNPRHRFVRVILTAGVTEALDEAHAKRAGADGTLQKPFEASVLVAVVRPLAEAAAKDRETQQPSTPGARTERKAPAVPFVAVIDAEQVRAAVTVGLDAAMESMVEEITNRVLAALTSRKPDTAEPAPAPAPPIAIAPPDPPKPEVPKSPSPQPVRRVTPVRLRSGSVLGLDVGSSVSQDPE
jgi:DNA-binding response OmpR family regulator